MSDALSGHFDGLEHVLPLRVYYEDTDAAGIVYYANYLKFAERARTEMLRLLGIHQRSMSEDYGLAFAVRDCSVDYRRPARLDDLLEVRSRLVKLSAAAARAVQRITREGEHLASVRARIACIRLDGKPSPIPQPLHRALLPFCFPEERV